MCNVHVCVDLWMVRFHQVPHSNQYTQASIESYHGALKSWFSFNTIGLNKHYIDWLVYMWKLIIIVARHYMHQTNMKKCDFINNKVVQRILVASVHKAKLITHINVIQLTLEGENNVNAWKVRNQTHLNVIYNLNSPFIDMHPSHASGHCVGIYASTKLLFFWHVVTLLMMIPSTIVACGMGGIVVG